MITDMRARGEPIIEIDGVTIDERDVEALRSIDEHGSMHSAAAKLGRSYARIQQRISELEATLGPLVSRKRGGKGGGGSTLTADGRELLARFTRLRAEFSGVARTEESVFPGTVVDRDGLLGTVETPAGSVRGIVPADTAAVQVSVRSDSVALVTPDEAPRSNGTTARNRFRGSITRIRSENGLARITVDIGAETPIRALVTGTSLEMLELSEGDTVVASFKATATRAVPDPDR